MSINPRDYDLDELRRMARERGGDAGGTGGESESGGVDLGSVTASGSSPDGSLRQGLYRELLPLAGEDATKPYLAELPEDYAGEHLVFEWLEFLLMHADYKGATEALSYYESVGWITEDAESRLNDYLLGLDNAAAGEASELSVDDHLLSLVYVAKLARMG